MSHMIALPSPVMKAYSHPSMVNFVSPRAARSTSIVSWGTGCWEYYLFPRLTGRSLLATQNKSMTPLVLCSTGPTGSTERPVGMCKKFNVNLKKWCDKQCLPVGAAAYIAYQTFEGGVVGLVVKIFGECFLGLNIPSSELELAKTILGIYYPLVFSFVGSPFLMARSFAVLTASTCGIPYVMKRLRRKEQSDILTSMVTGFGVAVVYSLVSGMRTPIIIANIGVICALACGLNFKLRGKGTATRRR